MAKTNVPFQRWKGPRCRVGDRCLIIKSKYPENLGLIVRTLRPSNPPDAGFYWFCRAEVSAILSPDRHGIAEPKMEDWLPDEYLLPIRGAGAAVGVSRKRPRKAPLRLVVTTEATSKA